MLLCKQRQKSKSSLKNCSNIQILKYPLALYFYLQKLKILQNKKPFAFLKGLLLF